MARNAYDFAGTTIEVKTWRGVIANRDEIVATLRPLEPKQRAAVLRAARADANRASREMNRYADVSRYGHRAYDAAHDRYGACKAVVRALAPDQ